MGLLMNNGFVVSISENYTRFYLHHIVTNESMACSLLSIHNVEHQLKLMRTKREAIQRDEFPDFLKDFMKKHIVNDPVPQWLR